ncbi:MAG: M20/M25/M40 family metallo-hydrolase [Symbiobacteriaceae bacterium]|nr:M20/M25/M40 family metallo-hydrolase [Symbiobacteriaceae bacterium]
MAKLQDSSFYTELDPLILNKLYASSQGGAFNEELCLLHGARFGGSPEEQNAAVYLKDKLLEYGLDAAWTEGFTAPYWMRKNTSLKVEEPQQLEIECIALPNCPPGTVTGPLVYLGDGDPQTYADNAAKLQGAIVMVSTANPAFYHRGMHRGEKLGRALQGGAAGFIWMRGEGGGLPETGSARFGRLCEVPVISVSLENGMTLQRLARGGKTVTLTITSDNDAITTTSYNVIGEIKGSQLPEEIIVVGGHYDGHDISQGAVDNGSGIAVIWEAAKAMAQFKGKLTRTIRFIGFAQEEMGLLGSDAYVKAHAGENIVFMLNLDGAGGGFFGRMALQGWSQDLVWLRQLFASMGEGHVRLGDSISIYSDMYPFAAAGIPAGSYSSSNPSGSSGAPRGYGHTYWDTIDKINSRAIMLDAIMVSRFLLRMATVDEIPLKRKEPQETTAKLEERGLLEVMAYEQRPLPHEDWPNGSKSK